MARTIMLIIQLSTIALICYSSLVFPPRISLSLTIIRIIPISAIQYDTPQKQSAFKKINQNFIHTKLELNKLKQYINCPNNKQIAITLTLLEQKRKFAVVMLICILWVRYRICQINGLDDMIACYRITTTTTTITGVNTYKVLLCVYVCGTTFPIHCENNSSLSSHKKPEPSIQPHSNMSS